MATSTNVLMELTTGFQGNVHLLYPYVETATGCVTSTSVMSHHAMPIHNSQIMLAHIPVLAAGYFDDDLAREDINECNACLVANVISEVTSFQPNHFMPMPIVSIKTVLSTVNATLNILEMVLNVLISTNVSTVATTVMQMLPVPMPSCLDLRK